MTTNAYLAIGEAAYAAEIKSRITKEKALAEYVLAERNFNEIALKATEYYMYDNAAKAQAIFNYASDKLTLADECADAAISYVVAVTKAANADEAMKAVKSIFDDYGLTNKDDAYIAIVAAYK